MSPRPLPRVQPVTAPAYRCAGCGKLHACLGLGPPAVETQRWYCGTCWTFLPHTQAKLAEACRAAIEEIMD
jgi:hypothetical protein